MFSSKGILHPKQQLQRIRSFNWGEFQLLKANTEEFTKQRRACTYF